MWEGVIIFINVLDMVHLIEYFVYRPHEIMLSLSQTTDISKKLCWSLGIRTNTIPWYSDEYKNVTVL